MTKIEGLERIAAIFNIFHDGTITSAVLTDGNLSLDIEIGYLAMRVNPQFTRFRVVLNGISQLDFSPWPDNSESTREKLNDTHTIFEPELEILTADVKEQNVEIVCNQFSSHYDYSVSAEETTF